MEQEVTLTRAGLKTPRAAAIASIVFSIHRCKKSYLDTVRQLKCWSGQISNQARSEPFDSSA
jgi:hypothetical protein